MVPKVEVGKTAKLAEQIGTLETKPTAELLAKMKSQFVSAKQNMEVLSDFPKFPSSKQVSYKKSITVFDDAIKQMDAGTMDAFEAMRTLGNKLPNNALKSITSAQSKALMQLDEAFLSSQAFLDAKSADDATAMKKLFAEKGVTGLSDEVVTAFKSAENLTELKSMTSIFTKADALKCIGK